MKVYFGFSYADLPARESDYREVFRVLQENDCILTRENWIDTALDNIKNKQKQPIRSDMFSEIMNAIRDSELCVFDVTTKAMSIGQQIAYAISISKPTLVVTNINFSDPFEDLFIGGNKSGFLKLKEYTNHKELEKIIINFLKRNSNNPMSRLNLNLERSLLELVEEHSFKNKISKTDTIRLAIQNFFTN